MKCSCRWLFDRLAALSLLLDIATVALSARSHRWNDMLTDIWQPGWYDGRLRQVNLESSIGELAIFSWDSHGSSYPNGASDGLVLHRAVPVGAKDPLLSKGEIDSWGGHFGGWYGVGILYDRVLMVAGGQQVAGALPNEHRHSLLVARCSVREYFPVSMGLSFFAADG